MINTEEAMMQKLVDADVINGFCIKVGEQAFDLHFTARKPKEDKKWYTTHHRLEVREDLVKVLRECG